MEITRGSQNVLQKCHFFDINKSKYPSKWHFSRLTKHQEIGPKQLKIEKFWYLIKNLTTDEASNNILFYTFYCGYCASVEPELLNKNN